MWAVAHSSSTLWYLPLLPIYLSCRVALYVLLWPVPAASLALHGCSARQSASLCPPLRRRGNALSGTARRCRAGGGEDEEA